MLGDNLAALRKKHSLTQQALADMVFVTRQTISKWEKNLSVPDADALVRLADALDATVPELLGEPLPDAGGSSDIAAALSRINDQLARQNRRRSLIWKVIAWVLALIVLLHAVLIVLAAAFYADPDSLQTGETTIVETQDIPEYP